MTNEQIVRDLDKIYNLLNRNLIILEVCVDTLEIMSARPISRLRAAVVSARVAAQGVNSMKNAIEVEQDKQEQEDKQ